MTTTAIIGIVSFLKKLLGFLTSWRKERHEAALKEELDEAKNELKEACDKGDLSDLISASKKIGNAGRTSLIFIATMVVFS